MKRQVKALELLTKDQLKISVKIDVGETITKIFFFFLKKVPLFILLCKNF